MRLRYLFLINIIMLALPLAAQQRLSLDECRTMALANNTRIHTATNALDAARELRREAFTKYFPEVSATAMLFKANKGIIEFGVLDLLTVSFLESGHVAGVQFVQPIFMGGQIYNGNKLAEVGEAVAELQRLQSQDDVAMTVEKYYWQIAALKAKRRTLLMAMTTVDSVQTTVQAALDAGVVTLNDLLEVKLRRSELEADSVDLDNGMRLCRMLLAQYIGAGDTEVDIAGEVPDTVPSIPYDIYRDPEQALTSTNDYQLLKQSIKAADIKTKLAVGANLPTVAAAGGWIHENALQSSHGFWVAGIAVSVPITAWWGGSHAIRRAKIEKTNAELKLTDDSQLLQIGMRSAWDDLTAAQRKAQIAAQSITQAAENLRIYQAMYDAGTTTITDLLGAQTLHRQSCDRLTEAIALYRVAEAQYRRATAQLIPPSPNPPQILPKNK